MNGSDRGGIVEAGPGLLLASSEWLQQDSNGSVGAGPCPFLHSSDPRGTVVAGPVSLMASSERPKQGSSGSVGAEV